MEETFIESKALCFLSSRDEDIICQPLLGFPLSSSTIHTVTGMQMDFPIVYCCKLALWRCDVFEGGSSQYGERRAINFTKDLFLIHCYGTIHFPVFFSTLMGGLTMATVRMIACTAKFTPILLGYPHPPQLYGTCGLAFFF